MLVDYHKTDSYTDFYFDPALMEDEELKEELRNDPVATAEILYRVGWALVSAHSCLEQKCISFLSLSQVLADIWCAVNYARLWPESHHEEVDAHLEDALGYVYDAKAMVDSSMAWEKYTKHVFLNLANNVKEAIVSIGQAILETDYAITLMMAAKERDNAKNGS